MSIVISPERAIAEGVSPQTLIAVAEWHEVRAAIIDKALAGKKRRAFGGPVSASDAERHLRLAGEIRGVASHVDQVLAALMVAA